MVLDDDFPWHLYQTEDVPITPPSDLGDDGFTVVRRKEKRPRKRKPSPPRKKKRKAPRRPRKDRKRTLKEKSNSSTTLKNSPRNLCPIRPVIKNEPKVEIQTKLDSPTSTTPLVPPGFTHKQGTIVNSQTGVDSLKPFQQLTSSNAMFMKLPSNLTIAVPFVPLDTTVDGPDTLPMQLDLTYPECTQTMPHFFVIPVAAPMPIPQQSV